MRNKSATVIPFSKSPLQIAHQHFEDEIQNLTVDEVQLRLVATLREIERARARINRIPELAPEQTRALYRQLVHTYTHTQRVAYRFTEAA